MLPAQFSDTDPSDLRIVTGETYNTEEGQYRARVYSFSLGALTWVDLQDERLLLEAGVEVIDTLPEFPEG
jgi:hypothetical protein